MSTDKVKAFVTNYSMTPKKFAEAVGSPIDDYFYWKCWWMSALYGMGPSRRMNFLDKLRADLNRK